MSETDTKRIIELKPEILLAYKKTVEAGFEGTMSDYLNEEVMDFYEKQTIEYFCVFKKQECPVRVQWKLKPESLILFCNVCPHKTVKSEQGDLFALQMMTTLLGNEKQEKAEIRKMLLELIQRKSE